MVTLAVAAATLLILIGMERLWPHSPAPLVAVGGGIAASWLLGLQGQGVSIVGFIPQGLSSLTLPDLTLVEQLLPGAIGIALMSFTETIAVGRAFARTGEPMHQRQSRTDRHRRGQSGRRLLWHHALGRRELRRRRVVRAAGGRSQRASLVTAGVAVATMLFLAPVMEYLPHAVLAAVVIVYSVGLIKPAEFRAIRAIRTMEFRWAAAALLGCSCSAP